MPPLIRFACALVLSAALSATAAPPHGLTLSAEPGGAIPGNALDCAVTLEAGADTAAVDLYAAAMTPDGTLLFLLPWGMTGAPLPYAEDLAPDDLQAPLLEGVPLPGTLPDGTYTFGALAVAAGGNPLKAADWRSGLATADMALAGLSPHQQAFVDTSRRPQIFVKTFERTGATVRIDETWVYTDYGLRVHFVNGVFVSEAAVDTLFLPWNPIRYHPEDYRHDTTRADIEARHGTPAVIPSNLSGSPFFATFPADRYLVYDNLVFGLKDGRLVVVAGMQ